MHQREAAQGEIRRQNRVDNGYYATGTESHEDADSGCRRWLVVKTERKNLPSQPKPKPKKVCVRKRDGKGRKKGRVSVPPFGRFWPIHMGIKYDPECSQPTDKYHGDVASGDPLFVTQANICGRDRGRCDVKDNPQIVGLKESSRNELRMAIYTVIKGLFRISSRIRMKGDPDISHFPYREKEAESSPYQKSLQGPKITHGRIGPVTKGENCLPQSQEGEQDSYR